MNLDALPYIFGLLFAAGLAFFFSGRASTTAGGFLLCVASCVGLYHLERWAQRQLFIVAAAVGVVSLLLAVWRWIWKSHQPKENPLVPCPQCGRQNARDSLVCPHCEGRLPENKA